MCAGRLVACWRDNDLALRMAIYHFSAKVIQRSHGRSAVAAAAYRSASELEDARVGQSYDYTAKEGVVHSEIMLPAGAPERWLDRSTLWNEVEAIERRRDAVLAREVEFALPRELSQAEGIALAQDFVRQQFVARGMVADLNVHWTKAADGELQPHAHVMLSMREIEGGGFGKKQRAWNDVGLLRDWREGWAAMANARLHELGHDIRIDHRSLRDQGIELEPQHKIGPAGARREDRGEDAERAAEHRAIARRNGEALLADPSIALDALTQQHSTFTRWDLARLVNRHTAEAEQFTFVMAKVEGSPELVRLGLDGRGQDRFTTRAMLAAERRMEAAAIALSARQTHRVSLERRRDGAGLGREQRLALGHVTRARDLSVVVGYAGTGKSTMLGVARQAWEAEGYTVRGAALSGIAAEGLEGGAGIESRTLHSLLRAWDKGYDALRAADVLVVDEAGMIGSRQMERLLYAAQAAGAKVVLVGDPEQLQAIEAGAAFRAIVERVGAIEISEVRRQRDSWQQEATRELATGRTEAALGRYEAAGMVLGHDTLDAAKAALVAEWDAARLERPRSSRMILAYRRDDVRDLNERARSARRKAGELGADQVLMTQRGERAFADGDRLYFLRNERGLGVKNGTLGTVERIAGSHLTVRLDGPEGTGRGRSVSFALGDYADIDHGYAATAHKSQGVTVDQAHVLATGLMDRHATYVALTRHRHGARLHWSVDEFGSRERLARVLGRERLRDTSLDYAEGAEAGVAVDAAALDPSVLVYAERRGLHPLAPVSQIVVRAGQAARKLVSLPALPALAARKVRGRALLTGLRSMMAMLEAQADLLGRVADAFAAASARRGTAEAAPAAGTPGTGPGIVAMALAALAAGEARARAERHEARVERAVLTLLRESTPGWDGVGPPGTGQRGWEERQALAEARERLALETPMLLAAVVPGSPEPTPEAVRDAIATDPWIGELERTIAALVARIYRDPDEARRRLEALEASAGLGGVGRALQEAPERFGTLLGWAPGLLTSRKAAGRRSDAMEAATEMTRRLEALEEAHREIPKRLRGQAMARQLREGTVVHDLSPGARVAVEALQAASAKLTWEYLRDWREMNRLLGHSEPRRSTLMTGRAPMLQAWSTVASDPRTQAELARLEASVRQRLTPAELSVSAQTWLESSPSTQQRLDPTYRVAAWAVLVDHAAGVAATARAWQAQADAARRQERAAEEKARQEAEQNRLRQEQQAGLQRRPRPRPGPSSGPSMG